MQAAGATPRDIVKLTYFIVGYDEGNRVHAPIVKEFLGSHRPTSTLVGVSRLAREGWLFEVEAVVAVDGYGSVGIKEGSGRDVDVVVVGGGLSGLQGPSL